MDIKAHVPTERAPSVPTPAMQDTHMSQDAVPVKATIEIIGCGGAGINLARQFAKATLIENVRFFDTSTANIREGEYVWNFSDGSGSGGDRRENAREIEKQVPTIPAEHLGEADVVILVFSTAGGSGSVIGPIMAREYARLGRRVICAIIADTSSAKYADNTEATLKTLSAIADNNGIFLPLIVASNDLAPNRAEVDKSLTSSISKTIALIGAPVYEVDRNDRLNWIDPSKLVRTQPGIKLLTIAVEETGINPAVMFGYKSTDMVDSLLVLTQSPEDVLNGLPAARQKKVGFYISPNSVRVTGQISSDISEINGIIDAIENVQTQDKAQKTVKLDRLAVSGGSDLVF